MASGQTGYIYSKMLEPSSPDHKSVSREDSYVSDPGSEAAVETDRFGFLLANGSTAGCAGPPPELVRQREAKWIDIISQWDHVLQKKNSKVKEQCQKGIPASLRAKCWPLLCGATEHMKDNKTLYQSLDSRPALQSWVDVIERDLDRQFPFHEMFVSKDGHGQRGLFRVLKAYTQYQPGEGYCQAQGPVAAVLLMNMPAEEAFWCLVQISEVYLPGYYSQLLEGVLFDAAMLSWVLKRTCPPAHRHLQRYGVEPLMFATDWLMCLFTRHLPFNTLLRVWDLFFCYGVRVLFQVAAVLVRRVLGRAEQRQECSGQMETLERLRGVRESLGLENDASFMAEVCSVPLSRNDLKRRTEKELENWRKDRPSSTFDPRGRCHGYWASRETLREERDRKGGSKDNLYVPLVRSASMLSLSPSLFRKRWGKRGLGGKVERHHSMGMQGVGRESWGRARAPRMTLEEEEDGHQTSGRLQSCMDTELKQPTGVRRPLKIVREPWGNQDSPRNALKVKGELKEQEGIGHRTMEVQAEQRQMEDSQGGLGMVQEVIQHHSDIKEGAVGVGATQSSAVNEPLQPRTREKDLKDNNQSQVPEEQELEDNTQSQGPEEQELENNTQSQGPEEQELEDNTQSQGPEEQELEDNTQSQGPEEQELEDNTQSEVQVEQKCNSKQKQKEEVAERHRVKTLCEIAKQAALCKHLVASQVHVSETTTNTNTDTEPQAVVDTTEERSDATPELETMTENGRAIVMHADIGTTSESVAPRSTTESTAQQGPAVRIQTDKGSQEIIADAEEERTGTEAWTTNISSTQKPTNISSTQKPTNISSTQKPTNFSSTQKPTNLGTEKENDVDSGKIVIFKSEALKENTLPFQEFGVLIQKGLKQSGETREEGDSVVSTITAILVETTVVTEASADTCAAAKASDEVSADTCAAAKASDEASADTWAAAKASDEASADTCAAAKASDEASADTWAAAKASDEVSADTWAAAKASDEASADTWAAAKASDEASADTWAAAKASDEACAEEEAMCLGNTLEEKTVLNTNAETEEDNDTRTCNQIALIEVKELKPRALTDDTICYSLTGDAEQLIPEEPAVQLSVRKTEERIENDKDTVDSAEVIFNPNTSNQHPSVDSGDRGTGPQIQSAHLPMVAGPAVVPCVPVSTHLVGLQSSTPSGDFRVRKSSSSHGSRAARRLSTDIFIPAHDPCRHEQTTVPSQPGLKSTPPGALSNLPPSQGPPGPTDGTRRGASEGRLPTLEPPKRPGFFSRLIGGHPNQGKDRKAERATTQKRQIPKIFLQDFSSGVGEVRPLQEAEEQQEALSSRERRRRRRERERKQREEEKVRRRVKKELKKEGREDRSDVQRRKGECHGGEPGRVSGTQHSYSAHTDSYF